MFISIVTKNNLFSSNLLQVKQNIYQVDYQIVTQWGNNSNLIDYQIRLLVKSYEYKKELLYSF